MNCLYHVCYSIEGRLGSCCVEREETIKNGCEYCSFQEALKEENKERIGHGEVMVIVSMNLLHEGDK